MNFNSSVDQNYPNQSSVGPDYNVAIPLGTAGDTPIHRKGVTTRLDLTSGGAQTANQTFTFGSIAAEGWLNGDVVYVSEPSGRTGAFTNSVRNIAGVPIATWASLLANGGMFVFKSAINDFIAANPGVSTI
jgi:hypothetical protein